MEVLTQIKREDLVMTVQEALETFDAEKLDLHPIYQLSAEEIASAVHYAERVPRITYGLNTAYRDKTCYCVLRGALGETRPYGAAAIHLDTAIQRKIGFACVGAVIEVVD